MENIRSGVQSKCSSHTNVPPSNSDLISNFRPQPTCGNGEDSISFQHPRAVCSAVSVSLIQVRGKKYKRAKEYQKKILEEEKLAEDMKLMKMAKAAVGLAFSMSMLQAS